MKILAKDIKHGKVKVCVENLDDLWYLSQIISNGDFVEGITTRKLKLGEKQEPVKKRIFVKISVEKVEFSKYSSILKINGTTIEELDDIPKGSYQSFNVEEGTIISIIKEEWMSYQLNLLEEASRSKQSRILAVAFDREQAILAWLKKDSFEVITTLHGYGGKQYPDRENKNFFEEITAFLEKYVEKTDYIILASPSFWKDELLKTIKNDLIKKKSITCNCSSATTSGLNEALKSNELRAALKEERAAKEAELVSMLETEIAKDGKFAYGFNEVWQAAEAGAIHDLLITESLIMKRRQDDSFMALENIMKLVDKTKGKVHIISSEHDAGKRLDGLGGIGAILRYKLF